MRTCPSCSRPADEDRLGEVHLPGQGLQQSSGSVARVGEDRDLIPLQRAVGEDVADDVAEGGHARAYPRLGFEGGARARHDRRLTGPDDDRLRGCLAGDGHAPGQRLHLRPRLGGGGDRDDPLRSSPADVAFGVATTYGPLGAPFFTSTVADPLATSSRQPPARAHRTGSTVTREPPSSATTPSPPLETSRTDPLRGVTSTSPGATVSPGFASRTKE